MNTKFQRVIKLLLILMYIFVGIEVSASPIGGSISHGDGIITTGENITNITQNTEELIIDWDSFNIEINETVNFIQPSNNSTAINNILDYDASSINGTINSNGNIVLINPRGLIFSEGSQINTAGIIVSTLSLAKESFINGEYVFSDTDESHGVIINSGVINASSGAITMIGESVVNTGIVQAELGSINVAAGSQAVLTFDEEGYLAVQVTDEVISNDLGLGQAVENSGELLAGVRVAVSSRVTSQLFDRAVNNSGVIKATGFGVSTNDTVNLNGSIETSTITVASNQLTGDGLIAVVNSIDLSAVNDSNEYAGTVNATGLSGLLVTSNNAEILMSNGDQEFSIGEASFSNFSSVDAKNSTLTGDENTGWEIAERDNELTVGDLHFVNIDTVTNGSIVGTNGEDAFTVIADKSVMSNSIVFNNITSIDAKSGIDTFTGIGSWDLLVGGNVGNSDLDIIGAEIFNSVGQVTLNGTENDDSFIITDTRVVSVGDKTFNGIDQVFAGLGDNDVQYDSGIWSVQEENSLNLRGITFKGIKSINRFNSNQITERSLIGTSGEDVFTLVADNTVTANGISYYGIGNINTLGGSDTVQGSDQWNLLHDGFEANGIEITGAQVIVSDVGGSIKGTDSRELFYLYSGEGKENKLIVGNQFIFSNIAFVDGGGQGVGEDVILSPNEQIWQFEDESTLRANGIVFSNIERARSSSSIVLGSSGEDVFEVYDNVGEMLANSIRIENVVSLDGNFASGMSDSLIINTLGDVFINSAGESDSLILSSVGASSMIDYKDVETVSIVSGGDFNSNVGFQSLNISANNMNISANESINIDSFDIVNEITISTTGDVVFNKDADFTGNDVNISADSAHFLSGLIVSKLDFNLDVNQLFIDGDVDIEVNVERSAGIDIGQDINSYIFSDINIFLASETSVRIDDAITGVNGFMNLIEQADAEL